MAIESPIEQLRNHLFRTLGLAALPLVAIGCGGRQVGTDEAAANGNTDDDDQGDASEDESSGSGSTETSTDTSTSTSTTNTTETETGEPEDCMVTFYAMGSLDDFPDCMLPLENEDGCPSAFYLACVASPDGQACDGICTVDGLCGDCPQNSTVMAGFGVCGPYLLDGQCCSVVGVEDDCLGPIEGRPFIVDGVSRLAAIDLPATEFEPLRRHLADHWARVAAAEHASVASFAQFALRLLAIAAPPALIRDTFAAAGDEVRHAEAALALAARLAGQPLHFGPLDVRGVAEQSENLDSLVLACVREGCIGETLAALELATAASFCKDPELAALLRSIADDETRHAGLAWRFVQWAIARDPDLRPKVAALFASLHPAEVAAIESHGPRGLIDEPQPFDRAARRLLREQGCLPDADRRRVEREGLRELLRPCAAAMLANLEVHARANIGP